MRGDEPRRGQISRAERAKRGGERGAPVARTPRERVFGEARETDGGEFDGYV